MTLPFAQTWWIEPGKIIGGCYPGTPNPAKSRQMLAKLLDCGVRTVINLQEPDERNNQGESFPDYQAVIEELARERGVEITLHRFAIPDWCEPSVEQMREIQTTLQQAVDRGELAYVHCWGGHGRTGVVAGCWLVDHGMSPAQSLAAMRQQRAHDPKLSTMDSPQSDAQRRMVRQWKSTP